jgi:hypothetical protein
MSRAPIEANPATVKLIANFLRQLAGSDWGKVELMELAN